MGIVTGAEPRSAGAGSGIAPTVVSALPQLHGQCYDNSGDAELRVTAILELGSPLEMIQLLQTPWEERFKVRKQSKGVLSVAFRPQTG